MSGKEVDNGKEDRAKDYADDEQAFLSVMTKKRQEFLDEIAALKGEQEVASSSSSSTRDQSNLDQVLSSSSSNSNLRGIEYLQSAHGKNHFIIAEKLLMKYKDFDCRPHDSLRREEDSLGCHILTFINAELEYALLYGSRNTREAAAKEIYRRAMEHRKKRLGKKLKKDLEDIFQTMQKVYPIISASLM